MKLKVGYTAWGGGLETRNVDPKGCVYPFISVEQYPYRYKKDWLDGMDNDPFNVYDPYLIWRSGFR